MSPHQQFDRPFAIHKEVEILTKKQERRTTNLDDTPLYSHANLLSCPCYDNLYITFSFFCTATSFIHFLTDNGGEPSALSFPFIICIDVGCLDGSFLWFMCMKLCFLLGMDHHRLVIDLFDFQSSHLLSTSITP